MAYPARNMKPAKEELQAPKKPRPILRSLSPEELAALDQVAANTGALGIPIDGHAYRALIASLLPPPPPPPEDTFADELLAKMWPELAGRAG